MLNTTDVLFYQTSSEFIGDLALQGMVNLLEMDGYRLTATLGGTVPTGSIGKRGITSTGVVGVLPFPMQGGSGTWDVLADATFQAQNEVASVGAQVNSVVRVHDNRRGYRRGDEMGFSLWGAYSVSDWASFSMRGLFEHWGEITGSELRTDGAADPLANPFAQGGGTRRRSLRAQPFPSRRQSSRASALIRVLLPGPRGPEWAADVYGSSIRRLLAIGVLDAIDYEKNAPTGSTGRGVFFCA